MRESRSLKIHRLLLHPLHLSTMHLPLSLLPKQRRSRLRIMTDLFQMHLHKMLQPKIHAMPDSRADLSPAGMAGIMEAEIIP